MPHREIYLIAVTTRLTGTLTLRATTAQDALTIGTAILETLHPLHHGDRIEIHRPTDWRLIWGAGRF